MQTQEFFQDSELEGLYPANRLAFLHLTTTGANAATTDATDTTPFFSEPQCTNCGNSKKRRSPSFPSEPNPKKLNIQEDDDDDDYLPHPLRHSPLGFTKIDLPISFPTTTTSYPPPSSPVLRRSFSDVCNNAGTSLPDSLTGSTAFLMNNPQSPENSALKVVSANAAAAAATTPSPTNTRGSSVSSLPPRPPLLVRSVSDPTPSASLFPVPVPAPTSKNSRSSSSGEMGAGFSLPLDSIQDDSPNLKMLRKMKDRMREMNQWLDELMREGEDDVSEDNNSTQKQDAASMDTGAEEVSVERLGECLHANFRCPCGTGYQFLLSGEHCYYKLL